jgi:uncharacterized membrane protein YesL
MTQIKAAAQVMLDSLSQWWYSWLILLLLNTMLVVCWITVLLGPPATFGFYYAIHSLINSHSTNWREFLEGMKRYFLKAWLWALFNIAFAFLLRISLEFYSQSSSTQIFLYPLLVISVLWLYIQFFAIPFMMEQEQKNLLLAFRNSLFTILASPLFALVLLIVLVFLVWLNLTFLGLILIGSPSFIAILGIKAVKERLKSFEALKTTGEKS